MATAEWNQDAYLKQKAVCEKLTDKGLIGLVQWFDSMTNEATEAIKDTLRERGIRPVVGGLW